MKFIIRPLIIYVCILLVQTNVYAQQKNIDTHKQKHGGTSTLVSNYQDCPCPHLIAHRGASGNYPESTHLAFEKALEFNTDILELDVHLSKDEKLIVIHDDSLLRTTGEDLTIEKTPWETIKQVNAAYSFQTESGDFPYREQSLSVLTLDALIEKFPHARFNIEIKPNKPKLAEALGQFISENKLHKRVVVASKHALALEHYRKNMAGHGMTSAHLKEIIWAYIYWLFNLDLDNEAYQLLQLPYQQVNKSLVDYLHRQGKQVHVWTVNEPEEIKEMLAIGVDGVMTDYPEYAYPIFVEMGLR